MGMLSTIIAIKIWSKQLAEDRVSVAQNGYSDKFGQGIVSWQYLVECRRVILKK